MKILFRWILNAGALILITFIVPGITVTTFYIALITALIIGFINITIKPIILFFTLPFNILSLGLLTFVINALLFWFVSSFIEGFEITGFVAAFFGALAYSIFSWIISGLAKK